MKKKAISAADAGRILQRNLVNIVKKSAAGKTLTKSELALIGDFAGDGKRISGSPAWVSSYEELGRIIGCHHHSFQRWRRDYADAPKPRANGDHSVTAWRAFFDSHPAIDLRAETGSTKHDLELERLRQQCRRIKFDNDVREGKYLAADYVTRHNLELGTLLNSTLRTKLEDELPPILAGMTAPAIRIEMKKVHDEICRMMQEGSAKLP